MFTFFKKIFRRKTDAQKIGALGEHIAENFLKKKGIKILERNWHHKHSEIDIIALDGNCIVFAEVKTRSQNAKVSGYYVAANRTKKSKVMEGAKAYLKTVKPRPTTWRYDILEVTLSDNKVVSVSHYQGV